MWDYLKENADYPYYLIRDRFAGAEGRTLRAVKRGQGAISSATARNGPFSRPHRRHHRAIGDLHPYGLRGRVERRRGRLGLPVPRVTFQDQRQRDFRAGRRSVPEPRA